MISNPNPLSDGNAKVATSKHQIQIQRTTTSKIQKQNTTVAAYRTKDAAKKCFEGRLRLRNGSLERKREDKQRNNGTTAALRCCDKTQNNNSRKITQIIQSQASDNVAPKTIPPSAKPNINSHNLMTVAATTKESNTISKAIHT
jgi:hypothetical protein